MLEEGHPSWKEEVEESVMSIHMVRKLKSIAEDLGILGVLVYIRLMNLQAQSLSYSDVEKRQANCQLMLNNPYSKDLPTKADNFLIYIADRMMNIAKNNVSSAMTIHKHTVTLGQSDMDPSWTAVREVKTFRQQIKDIVFPSIDEIYYCLKQKLVSKKDLILYKLILDFNEAVFNKHRENVSHAYKRLVPCSIKFYEQLSESEITTLLRKISEINQKLAPRREAFRDSFFGESEKREYLPSPEQYKEMFMDKVVEVYDDDMAAKLFKAVSPDTKKAFLNYYTEM